MYNRYLKMALLSAACLTLPMAMTSCKDYGDDIDNLQSQIDKINTDLSGLQSLISSGCVITSVSSTADGVAFTLSDGKTYEITNGKNGTNGTNGTNGVDGKNGTVWTIGTDGYWYMDGVKTDNKAIGTDGTNGTNGTNGTDGKNGEYYVPNASTGNFDIYQDGKYVKDSGISWRAGGITAVYSGNSLTIGGVKGADGKEQNVTIPIGQALGAVEFIPSVVSSDVPYPTTDKPFYYIGQFLEESKYVASTKEFIPQLTSSQKAAAGSWNKSNVVAFEYRVSPSDAYVIPEAYGTFINRVLTTRVDNDKDTLLNVASMNAAEGKLTVNTTYDITGAAKNDNYDVVAFQLWNGQAPYTSDYTAVTASAVDAVIVDSTKVKAAQPAYFYNRTKAIPAAKDETSDFIKSMVSLDDEHNLTMAYDDSIDLSKYVSLFSNVEKEYLQTLGFDGISYEYSRPDKYLANDPQKTNQQWFVKLDGSVLSANTDSLVNGLTPAIGRTPVVRVDAFMVGNHGLKKLVASAYIKVLITHDEVVVDPDPKDPVKNELPVQEFGYHALKGSDTLVGHMGWQDVNNYIYGRTGLTSQNFWNYYGGASQTYEINLSVYDAKTDKKTVVLNDKKDAILGQSVMVAIPDGGVSCQVTLDNRNTTTSDIKINVNNKVKTENTYGEDPAFPGKGAHYTVTITIKSNDSFVLGDVVIEQDFFVKEDCKGYEFNPNYYAGTIADGGENVDYVITKGKKTADGWRLEMNISEVFKMIDGKSIYQYYNTINKVDGIEFKLKRGQTNVALRDSVINGVTTDVVYLTKPLVAASYLAKLYYVETLVNGETCTFNFDVQFNNPFVAGAANAIVMDGNAIDAVTAKTAPEVKVVDIQEPTPNAIYNWDAANKKLQLTSVATNNYALKDSQVSVSYAFKDDNAYKTFVGQLAPGAVFKINENTGEITYDNLGTTLIPTYNLTVVATVTFDDISVVECEIPVTMQGKNK